MDIPLSLTVNGKSVSRTVDARTLLVQFLREQLQLTGTHVGCDTAQCGACTVHVDGRAVKSCNVLAAQVQGASVTTIEGLAAPDGALHIAGTDRITHAQSGFSDNGLCLLPLVAFDIEPVQPERLGLLLGCGARRQQYE